MQSLRQLRLLNVQLSPAGASQSASLRQRQRQQSKLQQRCLSVGRRVFQGKEGEDRQRISYMRPNERPYEFPTLVIDLDAEGNPDVRPYDEAVDGAVEADKWADAHASIDALAERLGNFESEIEASKARMLATAARPTAWRVLDRDIWSAVLRGPQNYKEPVELPDASSGSEESVMANVLHRNGISPRQTFQQIPLLLHREEEARKNTPALTEEQLGTALKGCESLLEARRVLVMAVQTSGGRAAIRANSAAIADLLGSFLQRDPTALPSSSESDGMGIARQISEALLDVSFALTLKNGEVSAKHRAQTANLWTAGLWAAALAGDIAAMRRFMQLGLGQGDPADVRAFLGAWTPQPAPAPGKPGRRKSAAELALEALLVRLRSSPVSFVGERAELFMLLTGVTRDMGPANRRLSFLTVMTHQPPADDTRAASRAVMTQATDLGILCPESLAFGELYTAVLAELGGLMGLWEQLRHQERCQGVPGAIRNYVRTDALVTAVFRYATWIYQVPEHPKMKSDPEPATRGCLHDLGKIAEYEQNLRPARTNSVFAGAHATIDPVKIKEIKERALLQDAWRLDDAFRAQVVEAFANESPKEFNDAIDLLLKDRIKARESQK